MNIAIENSLHMTDIIDHNPVHRSSMKGKNSTLSILYSDNCRDTTYVDCVVRVTSYPELGLGLTVD